MDRSDSPSTEPAAPLDPAVYVTERTLAERTGIQPRTWQAMRQRGDGPPFVRVSARCIRYRWGDVTAWLDARRQQRT